MYIVKEKTGILNIIIVVSELALNGDIIIIMPGPTTNRILYSNDIYSYRQALGFFPPRNY